MAKKEQSPEQVRAIVQRMHADALANGTHSPGRKHLCGKCDQWVDALFHRNLDGSMVSWECAPQSERDAVTKGRAAA